MAPTKPAFLLIHPRDNVLVCCRESAPGDKVEINGALYALPQIIGLGHKIARRRLMPGDKVVKHGVSIGSVTCAIETAAHIHSHNMKSDYLQSHTRQTVDLEGSQL